MNVMMYYITYLFGMAGLKGNNNLVASSIQYVINVFMTVFALVFIDRWGRRLPLLVGSFLMALWLFINAGLMASYGHPAPPGGVNGVPEESWQISGAPSKAVIACTYLFVASCKSGTKVLMACVMLTFSSKLRRLGDLFLGFILPSCSLFASEAKQSLYVQAQTGSSTSPW